MAKKVVKKPASTKMKFTPMAIILIVLGVLIGGIVGYYLGFDQAWEKKDKSTYQRADKGPHYYSGPYSPCEALTVNAPGKNEKITSPVTITVTVDNTNPKCRWTVFEAQAGTMQLQNAEGEVIGKAVLTTDEDWMTDQPVTYSGEMMFDTTLATPKLNLVITEDSPSGEPGKEVTHPLTY